LNTVISNLTPLISIYKSSASLLFILFLQPIFKGKFCDLPMSWLECWSVQCSYWSFYQHTTASVLFPRVLWLQTVQWPYTIDLNQIIAYQGRIPKKVRMRREFQPQSTSSYCELAHLKDGFGCYQTSSSDLQQQLS
jgi:hypothetical protein